MERPAPSDTDGGSSDRQRSSLAARAVVPALVVLALVAIVTVAATGSTSGGSDRSTPPADALLDTIFSLLILSFVIGFGLVVYAIVRWREHEWSAPRRRNDLRAIAIMLAFAFAFALALVIRERGLNLTLDPQGQAPLDRGEAGIPPPSLQAGSDPGYEFEFAWLPVVVVLVLVAVGVAALLLSRRQRPTSREDAELAADLALAVDRSLDDLRAEADPRRAVIAAYARFERVLALHGQPRRTADTPEEHLSRVLTYLEVDRRAVRRLTDLFVRAKFSQHEIDARMKDEAIAALEQVRDALRAIEERPDADATAGVPA